VTGPETRPRRRWKNVLLVAGVCCAILLAGAWYVTTDSFQAYVRARMVREIERITGGRAEVGSFHIIPFHMQLEVRDITVHGREARNDVPLAHVDHLVARVKFDSLLRTELAFHSVTLDHPTVHIAIAEDGTTNIPRLPVETSGNPIEPLFALSIDHLASRQGELIWGDRKIPLDFTVHEAGLQMDYSYLHGRYESRFTLGKVDTAYDGFRPFSWTTTLEFSLASNLAEIKSLTWNSGRSHLRASGRINDFRNPRFDGTYEAHADLAEVAAISRQTEVRDGAADFKGSGRWSLDEFGSSGAVTLRDVAWQDDRISLKKASGSSDYSVTDQQIRLTKIQGKLFGGSVSGEAQVDNWLHNIPMQVANKMQKGKENMATISAARPARKGMKEKAPGVESGVVHLRVRDVLTADVAEAVDTRAHPLYRFRPAGTTTGNVDSVWKESPRNAEISFALEVAPLSISSLGELPVTARMQGVYRFAGDSLELAQFNVNSPGSRVQAQGRLSDSSSLHVTASTSSLDEWRPLVLALGGPVNLPFRVAGSATFSGVAGGSFSSPTLAGNLVVQDFDFNVPATSRTPVKQVHWDSLSASVQYSSHDFGLHSGSLRRDDTTAEFDVNAQLQRGLLTGDSAISGHINLHHVDVASTASLAGLDYPVTGTADVSLQIAGTRLDPEIQGHIHAANSSLYGESIEKFEADLHVDGEVALSNIQLTHLDSVVTGSAAYTPDSHTFKLDVTGTNFDLAAIRQIQMKPLPIEGRADFSLQGSGTLDAPAIDAKVQIHKLVVDHEESGSLNVDATTKDGVLHLSGHSDFLRGTLVLDGTVAMRGDYPAKITAHTDHLDVDALWSAYLGQQLTGHSEVGGVVTMEGPLRHPTLWTLNGDMSDIGIEFEYAKLRNQGPVRFTYAERTIHIAPLHMVGEGTDVTGQGSIDFTSKHELDLTADGQVDLKFLGSFAPDVTASGLATIHMTVHGNLLEPRPFGTVQIKNGTINYAGLPSGLSEMNGSLTFTRDRAHIEELSARTGGGTLDFKGDATAFNHQINFNLTATGKDVRLRYPPGVSSTADAQLNWVGNRSASTISGSVYVTKLAVTPGFDFGSYLERSRQSAGIAPPNSLLNNIKLDVAVRTAPELQMKTAVARLSGDADLRLRGSLARPSVLGRADILEGDATFNGIKFRLERGDITFANPVAIEPQVDLQATTHVRNYDLDLTITGTPDRLNVNYRSEPPLPKSDIIALLALGRTSEESEQLQQQSGQNALSDEATAMIINQAINQTVSSRLQKLFGVSRIKIDPQGLATETNPTARGPQITIEQEFANNVSLTYSTNVSQSSQQIIEGEYFFTRNVSAVGTRDQNGVVSFDVRIRRRKK
jgi:translocation and assembly module TamB